MPNGKKTTKSLVSVEDIPLPAGHAEYFEEIENV